MSLLSVRTLTILFWPWWRLSSLSSSWTVEASTQSVAHRKRSIIYSRYTLSLLATFHNSHKDEFLLLLPMCTWHEAVAERDSWLGQQKQRGHWLFWKRNDMYVKIRYDYHMIAVLWRDSRGMWWWFLLLSLEVDVDSDKSPLEWKQKFYFHFIFWRKGWNVTCRLCSRTRTLITCFLPAGEFSVWHDLMSVSQSVTQRSVINSLPKNGFFIYSQVSMHVKRKWNGII